MRFFTICGSFEMTGSSKTNKFFAAVDFYLDRRRDDSLIGIHCTHGVNRTGYMIARYLIQRMGYSVSDALECITVARGHPIERDHYISNLGRNLEQLPKIMDGKDICRGRAEGEPTQRLTKRPLDKGKEHDKRHGPGRDNPRGGRDAWAAPVSPWEPRRDLQTGFSEPREEGFHRPRRSEFVDESQFQTVSGYWGGGVHHPGTYSAGSRPYVPPSSHFVQEGRRDHREEGRGMGLPGFDPRVPPPVFPQHLPIQHGLDGRRPAHSEFVRDDAWPPAVTHRDYEERGPSRDMTRHSGRLTPPISLAAPPHSGRYSSPPRHRLSPPRGRPISPRYSDRRSPSRRMSPPHSRISPPHGRRMTPPRGHRTSPSRGHRMSPSRGRRSSPPRGHRFSPYRGHSISPPRGHRTSPARSQRMSPPRSPRMSLPRGHRTSPPRSLRMSPQPGLRALTPPPPPRSFRTPPPPSRCSPSIGLGLSPPRRYGSPPRDFRPPPPRGGPMTPPYKPICTGERSASPGRGRRMTPSEQRGPNHRRNLSRSPSPSRDSLPPPKYQGRRSSSKSRSHENQDAHRGKPDHLDMKYGQEIEPFPLERSPARSVHDSRTSDPGHRSYNSGRTRSPKWSLDSRKRPVSPRGKTSASPPRRSSPLRRSRQPGSAREKVRQSPLPSASKSTKSVVRGDSRSRPRESPSHIDRNSSRAREWKLREGSPYSLGTRKEDEYELQSYVETIHHGDGVDKLLDDDDFMADRRTQSGSPPRLLDEVYMRDNRGKRSYRNDSKMELKQPRARTPDEEPRRRGLSNSPEHVESRRARSPSDLRRGLLRTPELELRPSLRTPEVQTDFRRGLLRSPEHSSSHRLRTSEPQIEHRRRSPQTHLRGSRRLRTPEPLDEPVRERSRTPKPRETSLGRGRRTPDSEDGTRRHRLNSPEVVGRRGQRSFDQEEQPLRQRRSFSREDTIERGIGTPNLEPEPREDFNEDYEDPEHVVEPEPFDDPRRHGVLRTPEPVEEESRGGGRYDRRDYRDDRPRYNRGGHFQRGRRPYNNYRGRGGGRGRISRGGPMRQNSYHERATRQSYLDHPHETTEEYHEYNEFRRSRSRSPIVIAREVPVADEFFDEEPDCRELLIEKRTTVNEEIGALSPTALELIGPDDEILFIGSDHGNSRSSIRRRPATSRLSPRLPGRLSQSPPPKKPVFERLDDKKVPVFERLDEPMPEPRPLMEVRPRFNAGRNPSYRGRGKSYTQRRPIGRLPSTSYSNTERSSNQGSQESRSSRGTSSRGISRGISSRGRGSRGRSSSTRGRPSPRGASTSQATSSGVRVKKPTESSESGKTLKKTVASKSAPEGVRKTTKIAQTARPGPSVRGKTSVKVSTKTAPKVEKSPVKKTRGAPRGRRI